MTEKRNTAIQFLRVCACLMVFLVHFGQRTGLTGTIRAFSDFGRFGVQLFFLISGFLAGKTFFDNSTVNIKMYYKKRMVAILPLYYLVIAYYFISENILNRFVSVIPPDELGIGWFRYVFLLNGFLNSDTYFWSNLGITWTIPIFMVFYLIAPWILRKVKTLRSSVIIWFVVLITTSIFKKFYTCTIFENLHLLFLGVIIYSCLQQKCHMQAIALFSFAAICFTILGKLTYAYISLFSCVMLALVAAKDFHFPNWLQSTIDVLDKYSYTLYLMHGVVFCSLLDRLNALHVSKMIIAALAILGTFFATWFVGKFIEKPIQRYLKNRFVN